MVQIPTRLALKFHLGLNLDPKPTHLGLKLHLAHMAEAAHLDLMDLNLVQIRTLLVLKFHLALNLDRTPTPLGLKFHLDPTALAAHLDQALKPNQALKPLLGLNLAPIHTLLGLKRQGLKRHLALMELAARQHPKLHLDLSQAQARNLHLDHTVALRDLVLKSRLDLNLAPIPIHLDPKCHLDHTALAAMDLALKCLRAPIRIRLDLNLLAPKRAHLVLNPALHPHLARNLLDHRAVALVLKHILGLSLVRIRIRLDPKYHLDLKLAALRALPLVLKFLLALKLHLLPIPMDHKPLLTPIRTLLDRKPLDHIAALLVLKQHLDLNLDRLIKVLALKKQLKLQLLQQLPQPKLVLNQQLKHL
jgi:hypothetical protein